MPNAHGSATWPASEFRLSRIAGYLIRRSQQVHNVLWAEEFKAELTSPQYAVLAVLAVRPHIDQTRVGELASLDKSSTADVVSRLVDKMWISRERDPSDARRNLLVLAPAAAIAFEHLNPAAWRVQDRLLTTVPKDDRADFVEALRRVARVDSDLVLDESDRTSSVLHMGVPGHLIRCAQQVHTAIWAEEFDGELTGPQYATMHVLAQSPGLNQRSVGERAALDKSTTADIIKRLIRRGWVTREPDPKDRRGKVVTLTPQADAVTRDLEPRVTSVQDRLLAPLGDHARPRFLHLLSGVAFAGNPPASAR